MMRDIVTHKRGGAALRPCRVDRRSPIPPIPLRRSEWPARITPPGGLSFRAAWEIHPKSGAGGRAGPADNSTSVLPDLDVSAKGATATVPVRILVSDDPSRSGRESRACNRRPPKSYWLATQRPHTGLGFATLVPRSRFLNSGLAHGDPGVGEASTVRLRGRKAAQSLTFDGCPRFHRS